MKISATIAVMIAFSVIGFLVYLTTKNDDLGKDEYVVSSSKVLIILPVILFLIAVDFAVWGVIDCIENNQQEDIIYPVMIGLVLGSASLAILWERLSFRIIVKKDQFIVRNFFMKSQEYDFNDLTDYVDIDNGIFNNIEAFIGDKKIINVNEWDNNFDQIRKTIRVHVKKNIKNNLNTFKVYSRLDEPILFLILSIALFGISFLILFVVLETDIIMGIESLPLKGLEFFIISIMSSIWGIIYGFKIITDRMTVENQQIIYRKYMFFKQKFNINDFAYATLKDNGGTDILRVYVKKNRKRKKALQVYGYYRNQERLISTLKVNGIEVKRLKSFL